MKKTPQLDHIDSSRFKIKPNLHTRLLSSSRTFPNFFQFIFCSNPSWLPSKSKSFDRVEWKLSRMIVSNLIQPNDGVWDENWLSRKSLCEKVEGNELATDIPTDKSGRDIFISSRTQRIAVCFSYDHYFFIIRFRWKLLNS